MRDDSENSFEKPVFDVNTDKTAWRFKTADPGFGLDPEDDKYEAPGLLRHDQPSLNNLTTSPIW